MPIEQQIKRHDVRLTGHDHALRRLDGRVQDLTNCVEALTNRMLVLQALLGHLRGRQIEDPVFTRSQLDP